MKASEIIASVETTLLDPSNQFWQAEELVSYIDEAQRQIVNIKPDANARAEALKLASGTRQALPELAAQLIDVTRNIDGPAITAVDRRDLDRMAPDWTTQTAARTIEHYMYDERDPTAFLVYPPAYKNTKVEVVYSATLEDLNNTHATLDLAHQYRSAIIEYVLYRAHSKDSQAAVPQRAQAHYQQFMAMLGQQVQSDQRVAAGEPDPNNPRELR